MQQARDAPQILAKRCQALAGVILEITDIVFGFNPALVKRILASVQENTLGTPLSLSWSDLFDKINSEMESDARRKRSFLEGMQGRAATSTDKDGIDRKIQALNREVLSAGRASQKIAWILKQAGLTSQ